VTNLERPLRAKFATEGISERSGDAEVLQPRHQLDG
jgi:hypothetical protein